MKKFVLLVCLILLGGMAYAQRQVIRNGNTFSEVSKKKQKETFNTTPYTYVANDGNKYPIYLSGNGKYFIIRKSSRSGKEYRQYLPEVKAQLEGKKK